MSALQWVNRPDIADLPSPARLSIPYRSINAIPPPRFSFSGHQTQLTDFQRYASVSLISGGMLACVDEMESGCFESRDAYVSGLPFHRDYKLVAFQNVIDAVDLRYSTLDVRNTELSPGCDVWLKEAYFPEGYTIREDIPAWVHVFVNAINGDLFWSEMLVSRIAKCGATGIRASKPQDPTGEADIEL